MKKNKLHITDQMLVSYLLDELSKSQRKQVEQWLSENPDNQQYFFELKQVWELSKSVEYSNLDFDEQKAWKNIQKQLIDKQSVLPQTKYLTRWVIGIAATFVVLFIGIWIFSNREQNLIVLNTVNKSITDTLKDGTIVTIAPNSKIEYNNNLKGFRYAKLNGTANFVVAHNTRRPFIVEVEVAKIQVVGTIFTVNTNYSDTTILLYVEQGKVLVSTEKAKEYISKSQKAEINKKTGQIDIEYGQIEPYFITPISRKVFYFDAVPLNKVADTLSKIYNVEIFIDQTLIDKKITASFENENIETIIEIISMTFDAAYHKDKGKFVIRKK